MNATLMLNGMVIHVEAPENINVEEFFLIHLKKTFIEPYLGIDPHTGKKVIGAIIMPDGTQKNILLNPKIEYHEKA